MHRKVGIITIIDYNNYGVFCQLEMHQNDKKNAAPKQSNFVNIRYEFLSYFHQGVL